MEKQKLDNVINGRLFQIPDYQRGYAWERQQWKDFAQDIDALIDDNIQSHYTGTLVIYSPKISPRKEIYGIDTIEVVDIVDGQQRLTTATLYLSIVLNRLIALGENDYKQALTKYIFNGAKAKLTLNNDTNDIYFSLITSGKINTECNTQHQKRLSDAYNYFKTHISNRINLDSLNELVYLKGIYDAITQKLRFSFYEIEEESEIGMTFELMNSRGKGLSVLELLKNYLMYWVYRNTSDPDKSTLTKKINTAWKDTFVNVSSCNGSESQCLRIVWILFHSHTPKNWNGYVGFKDNNVIPIRDFTIRSRFKTQSFITLFTDGLSEISGYYREIFINHNFSAERLWIDRLTHAGNIANFLPLMVAAKAKLKEGVITQDQYLNMLKCLEIYSYRVFLYYGKRSNTGISSFYKWAYELFNNKQNIDDISNWICDLCNKYLTENEFREDVYRVSDWYSFRNLLKYTLYEYEVHLIKTEGGIGTPSRKWSDLTTDSSFEHILPQTQKGCWLKNWNKKDRNIYLHDISNLVLTFDNSRYSNFDFERKKGSIGSGYCYSNSDIRQERRIASNDNWTVAECQARKKELSDWIIERWGMDRHFNQIEVDETEDVDNNEV